MYSGKRNGSSFLNLRVMEKASYAVIIPGIFGYLAYRLYSQNVYEVEQRALEHKKLEDKYFTKAKDNIEKLRTKNQSQLLNQLNVVKLQDFKRKIYAIGVYDDPIQEMVEIKDKDDLKKMGIDLMNAEEDPNRVDRVANNIKLIRDVMKDLRPESLVVEMCDQRYERWLSDVIAHPNYDTTMSTVHKIMDKKPEKLKEYTDIDILDSSMEYLIGIDYCSYRMPCKTVMGDRGYKISKKRYESKLQMLDVYKEALDINKRQGKAAIPDDKKKQPKSNIFDLNKTEAKYTAGVGLEKSISQLQDAIEKVKKNGDDASENKRLIQSLDAVAKKESVRSHGDIFNEVIIDEINEQLHKSIQKAEGEIIVLLIRQERLKSFEKHWKTLNMDFYQTQANKSISERLKKQQNKQQVVEE